MTDKNNSLILELDQLRKNIGSQNEIIHPSSKILSEMIFKRDANAT